MQTELSAGLPSVCVLTETYYPVIGGGETQARALAEDLAANGYVVTVVARRSSLELAPVEELGGHTVHRLRPTGRGHLKKWLMLFSSGWFFLRHGRRCDIILVSGFRVLGIAAVIAARLTGKTCILKADNNGEMSGTYFSGGIAKLKLHWAMALIRAAISLRNALFRKADAFIALSTDITAELQRHGVAGNAIHRIPNSYDTARFVPCEDQETKRALRTRFGFPHNHTIVVFTGRLLRSKGLPLLLRVWKKLREQRNAVTLVIVGAGGDLMSSCEAEIKAYVVDHSLGDSVFFAGSVRNVEDYLRAADIFIFPTEDEAFGISLIEAMACGLPPVATTVGGIKDIVGPNESGILVPPSEFGPLYEALEALLNDPILARRLGARAAEVVKQRYSRAAVVELYMKLFGVLRSGGA